jgi:cyclic di-GMP phosphodiesterase
MNMTGPAAGQPASATRSAFPARLLVVDDSEPYRNAIVSALASFGHVVESAADGIEAVAKMRLGIDLILLDADMPGMDGFEVARAVRDDPEFSSTPIIMVTGLGNHEDRLRALGVGVNDFVTKPFDLVELHLRTEAQLRLKASFDALKKERSELELAVERRVADLRSALEDLGAAHRRTYRAHLDTVRILVQAAEYKDVDTAAHIERIGLYSEVVARGLRLAPHEIELIREGSRMHDVGKIGVPDAILLKPGPLLPHEREVIEEHPKIGASILQESDAEVLRMGRVIALNHHERWDGLGYPAGLAGTEIPLEARICAVVDFFDALTMDRCYRDALPNHEVYEMMERERGRHFDPTVLDVFFENRDEIERIQQSFFGTGGEVAVACAS